MKTKLTLLSLFAIVAIALAGQPGVINFSWMPSTQPGAAYYFYLGNGTANLGSNVLSKVDLGTNTSYSVTNLAVGQYWSQTSAHDPVWTNAESLSTNLITFTIPAPPGALRIQ